MQADRCPPVVGMPEPWPRVVEPTAAEITHVRSAGHGLGGGIPAVPVAGFVETGRSPFLWRGDPPAEPVDPCEWCGGANGRWCEHCARRGLGAR